MPEISLELHGCIHVLRLESEDATNRLTRRRVLALTDEIGRLARQVSLATARQAPRAWLSRAMLGSFPPALTLPKFRRWTAPARMNSRKSGRV